MKTAFLSASLIVSFAIVGFGQSKRVNVRLEVDGKTRITPFLVRVTSGKKTYRMKGDGKGFTIPRNTALQDWVDVTVQFDKHSLKFDHFNSSNFDCGWTVGVDTPPYQPENLSEGQDPTNITSLYFIRFSGEPERQIVVVTQRNH